MALPLLVPLLLAGALPAQEPIPDPPPRAEGEGPFERLILRGGLLVDGTGAPPRGPVDIVVSGDRIERIEEVGHPGLPIPPEERPAAGPGTREVEAAGLAILPGFIDLHGHIGGRAQGTPAEYVFKLWLGHGVTTVRDPGSGNGLEWTLRQKERSEAGAITAPHLLAYVFWGQGREGDFRTPEEARAWVREVAARGADGIKFFGERPEIFAAALDEARRLGLRSACHHAQLDVARTDALDTAAWGLTTLEHWYGLPEALFTDRTVQDYPLDYNYRNEQHRFEEAGRLWEQAAPPGSPRWNEVMERLLASGLTLDPTFNIYEAARDLMRLRCAEWHPEYTLPSLWDFFQPSRSAHGSFWFAWGTEQEVAWRRNYRLWMQFVNEFKNRGGRVTTGSDSGFLFQTYGFGYIRELELLREAGFHPLEVIRAATLSGAEALGLAGETGSVEEGKRADLILVDEKVLSNLQLLYGTGAIVLDENGKVSRRGGVRWTIKGGILYDAEALRADVRRMVREAWEAEGRSLRQPGR